MSKTTEWRDHVEQRIRNWRQRTMNKSGDMLSIDDFMGQNSIDDLVDYVCDEWTFPIQRNKPEPVAWRFDQAKYRENDLRGRQWAFNVFSQTKPYMDEMVRNVTPLYRDPTPCQTCEALARTVMMDQTSHDTAAPQRDTEEPAAELRRLHEVNAELVEALTYFRFFMTDPILVTVAIKALAKAEEK